MNTFIDKLNNLGIELSDKQIKQFDKYYELLVEKNKVMNLTAITEYQEVLTKHFYDSLTLVKVIDVNSISNIIDIGTGAGFPGIPLKIAFPHLKVTLVDSLNKRINWLNEIIDTLELSNICGYHGRAENYGVNPDYREKYDVCVSRAVANLSTLSEYCIPFVKKGGCFVSYKAVSAQDEVNAASKAIKLLGGEIAEICNFTIDGSDMERNLVKILKTSSTPKKYPRKSGLPSKEPL